MSQNYQKLVAAIEKHRPLSKILYYRRKTAHQLLHYWRERRLLFPDEDQESSFIESLDDLAEDEVSEKLNTRKMFRELMEQHGPMIITFLHRYTNKTNEMIDDAVENMLSNHVEKPRVQVDDHFLSVSK
jgi:hypothetical protein